MKEMESIFLKSKPNERYIAQKINKLIRGNRRRAYIFSQGENVLVF